MSTPKPTLLANCWPPRDGVPPVTIDVHLDCNRHATIKLEINGPTGRVHSSGLSIATHADDFVGAEVEALSAAAEYLGKIIAEIIAYPHRFGLPARPGAK